MNYKTFFLMVVHILFFSPAFASDVSADSSDYYTNKVAPILEKRCVVCHGCYQSPCQLNLGSYEGLTRGASKVDVNANRPTSTPTTRLFIDAVTESSWREKGFHSVLENNIALSLVSSRQAAVGPYSMSQATLHALDNSSKRMCPANEDELKKYMTKYPSGGMPLGLPALETSEYNQLMQWFALGRPGPTLKTISWNNAHSEKMTNSINEWEKFLNGPSFKQRLTSRYLYEHLFYGHLYFSDVDPKVFFRLVRSKTPSGVAIDEIATRRPMDDPGTSVFYYRLKKITDAIVERSHIPYEISQKKLVWIQKLFINSPWRVADNLIYLPTYQKELAYSPFLTFQQIPNKIKYRYMLEDSWYFFASFIKGPICRSHGAANLIQDYFHVFYIDPQYDSMSNNDLYADRAAQLIKLPALDNDQNYYKPFTPYLDFQNRYIDLKNYYLSNGQFPYSNGLGVEHLWSGGENKRQDASLTVFRHFDTASVVRGKVGEGAFNALVLDYSTFERIYYTFSPHFDPFGSAMHNYLTRQYGDLLRREAEDLFSLFFPPELREPLHHYWYTYAPNIEEAVPGLDLGLSLYSYFSDKYVKTYESLFEIPSLVKLTNKELDPATQELFSKIGTGTPIQRASLSLSDDALSSLSVQAEARNFFNHSIVKHMPEVTLIRIATLNGETLDRPLYYTWIAHRFHLNIANIALDQRYDDEDRDTLGIYLGFLDSTPRWIIDIDGSEVDNLMSALNNSSDSKYQVHSILKQYGLSRDDTRFWPVLDQIYLEHKQVDIIGAGILDLNSYADFLYH